MRHPSRSAVFVFLLLLVGCDRVRGLMPQPAGDPEARYQLERDTQGRVVRLDKVTGEVTILKEDGLPSPPTARQAARSNERSAASTAVEGGAPAPRVEASESRPTAGGETTVAQSPPSTAAPTAASVASATPYLAPGARVTLVRPSPVFISANENQTPLEVLGHGATGRVMRTEGEWYLIEFQSSRWGRRAGYLKAAAVGHVEQPMDLSVPEPALTPMDLSVPDPVLEPLDLSVPEPR
jgi:hypothetical protein